ncbi:right-handed parallel beta-helix repeat-containing protein [Glacieibacterium megasporae]|uniref:right-handed parallel beta-helix repeat-containing protein n=1 Tax=Glacieibacterium megasporae TaxID=2835787 RepID=UPI001CAA5581|nr:right-handed parallel beta-helix repeat-containing protein [Polymorphobacter megasporae]UAJ09376.1 right-handed parallel beta-helix repeat-containing protein [Polymorphobacter megasporae]
MILLALALLAATPTTLSGVLAAAKPGDVIKLVPGNYPLITIKARSWAPAITIDASGSNVVGVAIVGSTGVSWVGGDMAGTVVAAGVAGGYGFTANASSANISVSGVHFSDFRTGVGYNLVNGGKIAGNWFTRMSADGIDVALARNIVIDRNACTEFKPGPAAHPDCIQLWSRPNVAPVADITITNNSAVGEMQGISLFNHVRDGVDDGGFDRVTIRGNTVLNTFGNGLAVYDCRGCTVRDNDVNSLPNYWHRAQLIVKGGSVMQCGNRVPMTGQGTPACTSS